VEVEAQPAPNYRPAPPAFERLAAEDVTFTYPGARRPAVDAVSVEVVAGEIVALVGENGSGKTTLAKLLYQPQSGRVLWDGVDAGGIDPDELRGRIAAIFHDFERYLLPARDNIGLGRHEWIDDRDRVVAAALQADADSFLSRLPQGYDTMLAREFFGGYDLSIGQWQRIAPAPAFFRDAPFAILDEPTAALDARAESRLALVEPQRDRVDAVAQPGRLRPVREDMAEMAVTAGAAHLGAHHPEARVQLRLDRLLARGRVEGGPAAAGVEFRLGAEELGPATGAKVDAVGEARVVRAGERRLGGRLPQHRVLLGRELRLPLRLRLAHLLGHTGSVATRSGCSPHPRH